MRDELPTGKDGGVNQLPMRDRWFIPREGGEILRQRMQYPPSSDETGETTNRGTVIGTDGKETPSKAKCKGIKTVLKERGILKSDGTTVIDDDGKEIKNLKGRCKKCSRMAGLFRDFTDREYCCLTRILNMQPDFREQLPALVEAVQAIGHIVLMLPKFHCELNMIEMVWGWMKRYCRERCDSASIKELQKHTIEALEKIPLATVRKYARLV